MKHNFGGSVSGAQSVIKTIAGGREHSGDFADCENLLEYINTRTPFTLEAPCAGKGRCGKCRVKVTEGAAPAAEDQRRLIPARELEAGFRLACLLKPRPGESLALTFEEKYSSGGKTALLDIAGITGEESGSSAILRKDLFTLPAPSLCGQASDYSRVLCAAALPSGGPPLLPLGVLKSLPDALRKNGFEFTLCLTADRILAAEPGDTRGRLYGAAVDIGTTTVAAYLVDMRAKKNTAVVCGLNAQRAFGADVISRIGYTINGAQGLRLMQEKIIVQINGMIHKLAELGGALPGEIYLVTLAGNTTMMHLALGIPPRAIAFAPFIPAFTEALDLDGRELGLDIAPGGLVRALPGISAYVGADITAAILACGVDQDESVNLLIDIGTNGEIVLGGRGGLTACAAAAGPAFEGAHISCGAGGTPGAIDSVTGSDGKLFLTTIAGEAPRGICGPGIIDLLAFLLSAGIVDASGRMISRGEADSPGSPAFLWRGLLVRQDGEPAFLLVPEEESASGGAIIFTQKDVREVQLAKAAIAAGIDTLMSRLNVGAGNIAKLYLAGGFGSYLHARSAAAIGLLPRELESKIQIAGNAAGRGAALCLLSAEAASRCENIRKKTVYVELSSTPEFMDAYIEKMTFPQAK
ncbi:MAG: ASKHA domain-containing protein [Spirochaetales bacterium]|jgi:uncharacterized 2Fe-2S/4Fe-4S cluster protein (DUF4445 family)|nr:ASKHA domain-containing protein [Spirochaetales bacterium]